MFSKLYTLSIFLLIGASAFAQNLVPNGSFEAYKNVPCSWNTVPADFSNYITEWSLPTNTSTDVHSTLADATCWANPLQFGDKSINRLGYQEPHSGTTMIGLYTYVGSHTWHEYIQVKLQKPLRKGQQYMVQMWVSAADNVSMVSNNLGMLFSMDAVKGDEQILAQPQFNYKEVIRVTDGWTLVSGSITATDDFEYLTIGNFFSDEQTVKEPINTSFTSDGAYYFIDDVVVMPMSI